MDRVANFANKVEYPYLMIIGEKDTIVDNSAARDWHQKTASKSKEIKLMAGSYHELSKEPNNSVLFESILKFTVKQLNESTNTFGALNIKDLRFSK